MSRMPESEGVVDLCEGREEDGGDFITEGCDPNGRSSGHNTLGLVHTPRK